MTPALSVDNVTKVFREGAHRVEALRSVSLSVARGEVVALEGPSGSGKTTLLSIMGCILTPTDGCVTIDGERVDALQSKRLRDIRRRKIGFVFQQYNLFAALTAAENVQYALKIKGAAGVRAEAVRLLERVGLGHRVDALPRDLSGGEKQRVAFARALTGHPTALLADEPTANLDSATGQQVLDLLHDLASGTGAAVVVVSHDPKVRRIAHRTVAIRDGRLQPDGAREGLPA